MVDQGPRRPRPDNTAGIAIWLDVGKPRRRGDLTRKRSRVVADPGRRLLLQPFMLPPLRRPRMLRIVRFGSACIGVLVQVIGPLLLTDLLTRRCGTRETARDADDGRRAHRQVSETRRDAGDVGDVCRMAHNPEVEGSNPSPATKAKGPFSNRERAFCLWVCARSCAQRSPTDSVASAVATNVHRFC